MPDKNREKGFWSMFRNPNNRCCGGLVLEEIKEEDTKRQQYCPPSAGVSAGAAISPCCAPESTDTQANDRHIGARRVDIEFMFLDTSVCTRCRGTEASLEEAIVEVTRLLEAAGVIVTVHKIHIQSEEQAKELGFLSSPTIRINGRDIQPEIRETSCESCGDLCGEDIDCRIWTYQGKEYTAAPKAMIINAILREVYGGSREEIPSKVQTEDTPENLKRFFAAKRKNEAVQGQRNQQTTGCCTPEGFPECCS